MSGVNRGSRAVKSRTKTGPLAGQKIGTKYLTDIEKKAVSGTAFAWSAVPESDRKMTPDLLDF
jgi:hypothetical protein